MKLSIVIPAHNEELRLTPTLRDYALFFQKHLLDQFEIIVVVNHCADGTEQIAQRAATEFGCIRVIVEPSYIGKGGAVEMGFKYATGRYIGFVDADGATPPSSFFQLLENIGNAGCVIGSRWIDGATVNPQQSWMRRVASRVLNRLFVRGVFGLEIYDSQCGAKIFSDEALRKILPEVAERGWAFDIDLLCRLKRQGYSIRELPIEWHHVPGNPTTFFVMSMQMLASVWRVKKALNCRELSL